jgi:hypothetical protein
LAFAQTGDPGARRVEQFEVEGVSRFAALAKLGALTKTSLLIEAGSLPFLQTPVTLSSRNSSVDILIANILHGRERYLIRHRGLLLILSPAHPARPLNRMLTVPLGTFSFTGDSLSSLSPYLEFYIRRATGCQPSGYSYVGPALRLAIPPIKLKSATFESVVARVAEAPEPIMWVVEPDSGERGCIGHPASHWEVGLYGTDRQLTSSQTPLRASIGPELVNNRRGR